MQFLIVSYSLPKPSRYYVDGKRVSKDAYWDSVDYGGLGARPQNSFHSRTTYDAAGNATRREYCCR